MRRGRYCTQRHRGARCRGYAAAGRGLEVAATLRHQGSTAAVVFLTVHDDEDFLHAAQEAGGTGYVVKRRLASVLIVAVQEARAGRSFVSALS